MENKYTKRLRKLTMETISGCWIAKGALSTSFEGERMSLAKMACLSKGEGFKYKQEVFRVCGDSACYNPEHLSSDEVVRFFSFVNKTNHCWLWIGTKDGGGYGMFMSTTLGITKAHRFSYMKLVGKIPDGYMVLHKCDNPSCVNPKHLFTGTHDDNMSDKVRKARQSRLYGDRNGRNVLSESDIVSMRKDYASGKYSYRDLVEKYGISQTQVSRIVKGTSWKWLK